MINETTTNKLMEMHLTAMATAFHQQKKRGEELMLTIKPTINLPLLQKAQRNEKA